MSSITNSLGFPSIRIESSESFYGSDRRRDLQWIRVHARGDWWTMPGGTVR